MCKIQLRLLAALQELACWGYLPDTGVKLLASMSRRRQVSCRIFLRPDYYPCLGCDDMAKACWPSEKVAIVHMENPTGAAAMCQCMRGDCLPTSLFHSAAGDFYDCVVPVVLCAHRLARAHALCHLRRLY